jgi:hypothetical protein
MIQITSREYLTILSPLHSITLKSRWCTVVNWCFSYLWRNNWGSFLITQVYPLDDISPLTLQSKEQIQSARFLLVTTVGDSVRTKIAFLSLAFVIILGLYVWAKTVLFFTTTQAYSSIKFVEHCVVFQFTERRADRCVTKQMWWALRDLVMVTTSHRVWEHSSSSNWRGRWTLSRWLSVYLPRLPRRIHVFLSLVLVMALLLLW